MEKCVDCNSILTKQETVCYSCGSAVQRKEQGPGIAGSLVRVINVLLVVSGLLTLASIFFSFTPPFMKCGFATLILGIVKSSADQMWEKKKK
jgi:uncharacterized membrane protein HdeD (DUF308 family)